MRYMAAIEIILWILAVLSLLSSQFILSVLIMILIEIRDICFHIKSKNNKPIAEHKNPHINT